MVGVSAEEMFFTPVMVNVVVVAVVEVYSDAAVLMKIVVWDVIGVAFSELYADSAVKYLIAPDGAVCAVVEDDGGIGFGYTMVVYGDVFAVCADDLTIIVI